MRQEIWSERVRDTRLPGRWGTRLDNRVGWRLRRFLAPLQPVLWLATGTPASRIGYGPGPVTALRRRRHARAAKPIRLCLLEGPVRNTRFSPVTAYWINERSEQVHAGVDDLQGADVVWVHTQDPVPPEVADWLADRLREVPEGVPVLNRLGVYDAYHWPETFSLLREAGVDVPDPSPQVGDLVVVKGPGQASRKSLERFDGRLPEGHRAFAYVDARGPDGLHRRYRAFHLLGLVHAGDLVTSSSWQVGLSTLEGHVPTFELTDLEQQQVRTIGEVLGLDWFCVDFVRDAEGTAVFTDINVYPTPVVAERIDVTLGARGRWHFLDTSARMGVPEDQGSFWPRFDQAMTDLVAKSRAAEED